MVARQSKKESSDGPTVRKTGEPAASTSRRRGARKPRCASLEELQEKARMEALEELTRRGWLAPGRSPPVWTVRLVDSRRTLEVIAAETHNEALRIATDKWPDLPAQTLDVQRILEFRGRPIDRLAEDYGPSARPTIGFDVCVDMNSPALIYVRAIDEALRAARAHVFRDFGDEGGRALAGDDESLRRLLQKMHTDSVLAGRFDARPPGALTPEQARYPLCCHDTVGTSLEGSGTPSRKLLVDAVRREKHFLIGAGPDLRIATREEIADARALALAQGVRLGTHEVPGLADGPILIPRRVALLSIFAGWWPKNAKETMTPAEVIELEEKNARRELDRQKKAQEKAISDASTGRPRGGARL